MAVGMAKEAGLEFDWDESNLLHLARHRISRQEFEQATRNDPVLLDYSEEAGEERWRAVGSTDSLRVLLMVFTFRGERLRPITGWEAGKKLREFYFRQKGR
jgi:uncharacterized protein